MKNRYEEIVLFYFETLNKDIHQNNLNLKSATSSLMVIADFWSELCDKELWLENIYKLLCDIKEHLGNILVQNGISSFNGLGDLLYTVSYINDKTTHFGKFYYSLRNVSIRFIGQKIKFIKEEISCNILKTEYYDLANGLAGLGMFYLSINDMTGEEKKIINNIIDCLIQIHLQNNAGISNWFIKCENQMREEDKKIFMQGSLDLGLAHGIAGVALFLSKAYYKNIIKQHQKKVIMDIVEFYLKIGKVEKEIWECPSQIGLEDFVIRRYNNDIRGHRMSWCYGSLGILRALQLIGRNIKNTFIEKLALTYLLKVAAIDILDYKLESPIICHGYAGIITILNLVNLENPSDSLTNRIEETMQIEYSFFDISSHFGFRDRGAYIENGIRKIEEVEGYNLLNSSHGIILSLHSLINSNPGWEKRLFIM